MRWPWLRHPIYGLPFDAPIGNALQFEYERLPRSARAALLRKVAQRESLLLITGQTWHRVERAPAGTRRMLWIYNWGTIGDALMDLAVRRALPADTHIELYISAALAPLFSGDPCFAKLHTRIEDCTGPYDFVLLQDLATRCVTMKNRCAWRAPFATMFDHLRGERFDRMSFAQRRIEQLFGLPSSPPQRQWLPPAPRPAGDAARTRVAVALGARDARRRYRRWPAVLQALLARWPAAWAPAQFVLLGDRSALEDLHSFPPDLLARHCRVEVDRLDLAAVVRLMHGCDAFLGADGGLMHIAVACDLPGVALFVEIDPTLRLLPGTRLHSRFTASAIGDLAVDTIAEAFVEVLGVDQATLRTTASICASADPPL